jgi:DNA-binding XRE family transcriptional regulator
MNIQDTLIQNMITVRKHHGLTQSELGKQIGYSDKTISKWEHGDSCPSIEAVYQLARFYGVSIDDLLSESFQIQQEGEETTPGSEDTSTATRDYRRAIAAVLSPVVIYAFAAMLFAVLLQFHVPMAWLAFIDAIPVSFLTLLILGHAWNLKVMTYITGSGLMWGIVLAVYLHLLTFNPWVVFLPPVPFQIALILLAVLKKK